MTNQEILDTETRSSADEVLALIEGYFGKQRDILRLVEFVADRQHELDDRQAKVMLELTSKYPEYPEKELAELISNFGNIGNSEESDPKERTQDQITEVLELIDPPHLSSEFVMDLARAHVQPPSAPRMFEALLTTLVSDFEVFVGDLMRLLGKADPSPLMGDTATFTWREVSRHESIESFRDTVVEARIGTVLRGSMLDWMGHLERTHKVKLPNCLQNAEFAEVFERRNLIVHAGGVVSDAYRQKFGGSGQRLEKGGRLRVSKDYLDKSADLLFEVAYCLIVNSGKKISDNENYSWLEGELVNIPFRLLQIDRADLVSRVCGNYLEAPFDVAERQIIMKVNFWLGMKLAGKFEQCREDVEEWQVSMLKPMYRFAKLSLLDRVGDALQLGKEMRASGEFPMHHWLTWPLVAKVREFERQVESEDSQQVETSIDLPPELEEAPGA